MKAWVVCTALLLLSPNAIAQSQGGPPPANQGARNTAPPPGDQDQQGNGPPPGYQDNGPPPGYQDNGPPPGYDDSQDDGPPPDDQGQQGDGPPPGYQGNGAPPPGYQGDGPPPGYQDNQPPPGYEDQQGNRPSGANGPQARPGDRRAPGTNPQGAADDRSGNDEFGGWVLVTSDANWQAKWETPSSTMPSFTVARDLTRGKKVFVLIFFANPQIDRTGQANVTCDIEMTRPDGSVSTKQSNAVCFSGKIDGDTHQTYLSAPVIGFVGDPGDPAGTWRVKVTIKDNNRHVSVPAQTSFTLKK